MASCVKYYSQILMSSLALSLVGCATLFPHKNPDYDPSKSHHRPDGYANRYSPRSEMKGLWRWQWERLRDGLPKPPFAPVLGVPADLRLIHGDSVSPRLTWIGHATVLLQVDGLNLLTDPHWGERASPFSFAGPKRHQPPGLPLELLPPIHAVVISHNHWDHLDRDTLQMLIDRHPSLRFYVPLGLSPWFASNIRGAITSGAGRNVFAVDWDESAEISGRTKVMELRFLAVQHWSARGVGDRYQSLWGSWAMLHPDFRFWFAGDLGYSPDTCDIGAKIGGFDLAAIPIGAYEPRWFMRDSHLNPQEALQVMRDVKARSAVAIHWGTFEGLSDEPLDQPPKDLEKAKADMIPRPDFFVLKHGETWSGVR